MSSRQDAAAATRPFGLGNALRALRDRLTRPASRVGSAAELAAFLDARGAFISQKSTLDYLRARAGLGWQDMRRDETFGRAVTSCRWEAYAAVLGDVAETALIYLRHQGQDGTALADGVAAAAALALTRHPVPAHRTAGWDADVEELTARLRRALLAAPRPVHEVGRVSARRVFEVLPIHTNLKRHDREMVTNNIRFLLCRAYADLEAQADAPALGRALTER